jgi:hypothetical protein
MRGEQRFSEKITCRQWRRKRKAALSRGFRNPGLAA